MFQRLVAAHLGRLGVAVHNEGARARFGFNTGEQFVIEVHDPMFWRDWVLRGSFGLGETYVDGKWDIDPERLEPFIRALLARGSAKLRPLERLHYRAARMLGIGHDVNDPATSHARSSHHYDRGNDLFQSFLDRDMVYSCGFFDDPDWDLETAQRRKIVVTLERLDLYEGACVLDIGCGWGTLAIEASRRGARATGITLSQPQIDMACQRAAEQQQAVRFEVADYRPFAEAHAGAFDRVVSIGMLEHVGLRQYEIFFGAVRRLLKPGGKAVVHSIVDWPFGPIIPWLERYIFPGGQVPHAYDMIGPAARAGLRLVAGPYRHDGRNYATTLAHWRRRFEANYHTLDHDKYPERFRRLWAFYLAGCEAAFRGTGLHNAQVVYERP